MLTIPEDLQNHLNSSVHKLGYFWKVTRQDGIIKGFTSHTSDVKIAGITYHAATGYKASQINQSSDLSTDGMDIIGVLDSDGLSEDDLLAGLYDFAEVEIFIANYENPDLGIVILKRGWLGQVRAGTNNFIAEFRSMNEALNMGTVGNVYMPLCQAILGDSRCGVNLTNYTNNGTVTGVTSRRKFTDTNLNNENNYFQFGILTWVTGANAGIRMEVKSWTLATSTMELFLPMPYDIQVGDTYTVHAGCNKTRSDCLSKFSNLDNFYMGFPDLPGLEKVL